MLRFGNISHFNDVGILTNYDLTDLDVESFSTLIILGSVERAVSECTLN